MGTLEYYLELIYSANDSAEVLSIINTTKSDPEIYYPLIYASMGANYRFSLFDDESSQNLIRLWIDFHSKWLDGTIQTPEIEITEEQKQRIRNKRRRIYPWQDFPIGWGRGYGELYSKLHQYPYTGDSKKVTLFRPCLIQEIESWENYGVYWLDYWGAEWIKEHGNGTHTGTEFTIKSIAIPRDKIVYQLNPMALDFWCDRFIGMYAPSYILLPEEITNIE